MINNLINFFQKLYQDNPSVAAILGVSSAGIVTSIMYLCRNKIQSLFYLIKKQFTVTFLITNDGGTAEVYGLILKWLKKYNKLYTRSLTAPQQLHVDELSKDKISDALQYGLGRHLIWFHRRPIWLHIYEEKLENSRERKLYLSMSIIGRSHNLIYDLLDEVYKWNKNEEIETNKDKTRVNIYGYSGIDCWEIIRKRGFDTIYLSSKIEAEIKHNIQKFLDNEKIYVQHGIPYHYGMILYGPPGTGKTSIIKAIASEFDFDISLIDPLKFDITRLREKKENDKIKLLVIEDIDLLLGTKRETVEDIDIDEEEDIIGEIIKVDRILYEEYELKKTMTVFEVSEYSLFFANGEDGQKRIFLLDNGYYLLDKVNATDKEIILQVKEYLGKNSSPYFNGVNDEKQKLGIIEDKEIGYDVKIPRFYFNNKATFLKDEEGVEYSLIYTENDKLSVFIDDIRKKIIGIRKYTPRLEGHILDSVLFYCNEDEDYLYFSYYKSDEDNEEHTEQDYDLRISISEMKELLLQDNSLYFIRLMVFLMGKDREDINNIRNKKMYIVRRIDNTVYCYSYEDEDYFYFDRDLREEKRYIEQINSSSIRLNSCENNIQETNQEENDTIELTVEKLTEILQSKDRRYTTFEDISACLVGSPINGIRSGDIGIIDKDISVEENKWKVYTYNREDEKRFYFDYSLKLSTEANDILPKWRMRHARQEYNERHKINELKENYDLKFTIEEIEELIEKWNKNKSYPNYSLFFSRDTLYDKCISPRVVINDIRYNKAGIIDSKESKSTNNWVVYTYVEEDEDYFYFNYSPKMSAEMDRDVTKPIGAKNQEELIKEQKLDYDYSIPINILEGNSWEKPFATNEGDNLYIWQSGMNNPIENIPSQGIKFVKHLIAENLYFYDAPKSVNFTKAYRYVSHDENNIYIKEVANYQKTEIIKGDPFSEEFEIAKSTDSKDFAPIKSRPKTKVITSGKDSAGKKVLRDLMNAIDGLITKENFIIIATTNSIESLDPALIRPGRFDTVIKIDYIDIEVFNKAMMRYFGKTVEGTLKKKNLTISRLQVEFLMGKTFEDFKRKYIK